MAAIISGVISRDEFYELNIMLVKDGLNNPAVAKLR